MNSKFFIKWKILRGFTLKKKTIKGATYKSTVVGGTIGIRARKW